MGLYLDPSVSHRAGLCGPIPRPVSQYLTGQGCVGLYTGLTDSILPGRASMNRVEPPFMWVFAAGSCVALRVNLSKGDVDRPISCPIILP